MPTPQEKANKAMVLEAFDMLLNKSDFAKAEKYWSPNYIQHSATIAPGRDALFEAVKSMPDLHYEFGLAMASNDYVVLHARMTGGGQPRATIVADVLRIENGVIAEHWDVMQPEATEAEAKGRRPMWGDSFPS
jgi:predicted SnoaL-like aldol condensation-catalyzing enzyme